MEDNIRQAVMDYFDEFMVVESDKQEMHAEGLDGYLQERGFAIVDDLYVVNNLGHLNVKTSSLQSRLDQALELADGLIDYLRVFTPLRAAKFKQMLDKLRGVE